MNLDEFWDLIDNIQTESDGDADLKMELMRERLAELSERDLQDFSHHFTLNYQRAYTWALWGAAYIIFSGCSDDAFRDFRASLISLGRRRFEAALLNPESLASISSDDENALYTEGFDCIADDLLEELYDGPDDAALPHPKKPFGEPWNQNSVRELFPILAARFKMRQP